MFDDIDAFDYRFHLSELPKRRQEKALKYRQELDRKLCVASYLLLSRALNTDYGISGDLQFTFNQYGKPFLTDYPEIFFNISHCCYGATCAVSDCEIGADIQDIRTFSEATAQRVFCAAELERLDAAADREREFARLWSMKEAYLKMLGTGISDCIKSVDTTVLKYASVYETEHFVISAYGAELEEVKNLYL